METILIHKLLNRRYVCFNYLYEDLLAVVAERLYKEGFLERYCVTASSDIFYNIREDRKVELILRYYDSLRDDQGCRR